MRKLILTFLATAVFLVGCQSSPTKGDIGAVTGGIVGGVFGSQIGDGAGNTIATLVGVLAGAYIGGYIGDQMDANDQSTTQKALSDSPDGKSTAWVNEENGLRYTVTPTSTYMKNGVPCRRYKTNVTNGSAHSEPDVVDGQACLHDGVWKDTKLG